MLDFRMYTFIALSKTLNYTKAAEQLCMSQPAVTQHIQYLENLYQVKLFTHENKQLRLSKQGELLLKYSLRLASDEKKLKEIMCSGKDHMDHIRIGATRTIGEFILPNKFTTLLNNHPDTSISMLVENTSTLLDMLNNGQIDFAFVEGYFKKNDYTYHLLSKQRFIPIKSKDYPLSKTICRLEELVHETLIIRECGSGTREILERVLNEQNLTITDFKNTLEIGNIHAIKEFMKQQQGITFLYEAAVLEELKNGQFEIIPLDDFQITREFNFITLKNSIFTDFYTSFLQDLKES